MTPRPATGVTPAEDTGRALREINVARIRALPIVTGEGHP